MKPVTTTMTGSSNQTKNRIAQYTSVLNNKLYKANLLLETAGYIVVFSPVELWQHRCILAAWNPTTGDGYLIGPDELGLICHYGADYLNPHGYSEPRYKDSDNKNRIKHYAEAVIARAITEVQTAQPGTRNQTLSKAAFIVGRYLLGWQLDPDSVQGQLLEAALSNGLDSREASTTIKRGLEAGQRNPRSPEELLSELVGEKSHNDIAAKHLAKLSRKLGGRP